MNYIKKKLDLNKDIELIVYTFCTNISNGLCEMVVKRGDSQEVISNKYTKPEPVWRMKHTRLWGFRHISRSPNPNQKRRPNDNWHKKEKLTNSGLCHPGEPQSENQRKGKDKKYLNLAREQ